MRLEKKTDPGSDKLDAGSYYWSSLGRFAFASEYKAFLALPIFPGA
jgi:hypothetical protein